MFSVIYPQLARTFMYLIISTSMILLPICTSGNFSILCEKMCVAWELKLECRQIRPRQSSQEVFFILFATAWYNHSVYRNVYLKHTSLCRVIHPKVISENYEIMGVVKSCPAYMCALVMFLFAYYHIFFHYLNS